MKHYFFSSEFIYLLEQENQGGFTGPDPTKFLTSAMYAMSAAWSPNLNNPPFYVDLPLEFQSHHKTCIETSACKPSSAHPRLGQAGVWRGRGGR